MKINNQEKKGHISIMFLPFVVNGHGKPENAFDVNNTIDNLIASECIKSHIDINFESVLCSFDLNDNFKIRDKKHHPHIFDLLTVHKNLIKKDSDSSTSNTSTKKNSSFYHYPLSILQFYDINLGILDKSDKNINLKTKRIEYRRSNHFIEIDDYFKCEFHQISVIYNKYSRLGYLLLAFEIYTYGNIDNYAYHLSSMVFFRFYLNQDIKNNNKYKLKYYRKNPAAGEEDSPYFSIQDFIEQYLIRLLPHIQFLYHKPVLMHLFHSGFIPKHLTDENIYNTIRIVTPNSLDTTLNTKSIAPDIVRTSADTLFCAMNEGAFIIDSIENSSTSIIKKYLPSFIIALNQREILIQVNRLIPVVMNYNLGEGTIISKDVKSIITKHSEKYWRNYKKENLNELRERITLYQLQQVFYTISFYDEIDAFYRKLQMVFKVDLLLEDNRQSIAEINTLLDKVEHEESDKRRKKTEKRNNAFIILISVIQVVDLLLPDSFNRENIFGVTFKFWHLSIALAISWIGIGIMNSRKIV